jgi:hypothetical protein
MSNIITKTPIYFRIWCNDFEGSTIFARIKPLELQNLDCHVQHWCFSHGGWGEPIPFSEFCLPLQTSRCDVTIFAHYIEFQAELQRHLSMLQERLMEG